jgi:hypothetical protein
MPTKRHTGQTFLPFMTHGGMPVSPRDTTAHKQSPIPVGTTEPAGPAPRWARPTSTADYIGTTPDVLAKWRYLDKGPSYTVATWLDDDGVSGRQVANQLGHAKPSMTLDRYMSRRAVTERAALVL